MRRPVLGAPVAVLLPSLVLAALAGCSSLARKIDGSGIDHILLGVANLDRGIEEFAAATGVRPAYGGKHPRGTHNALVALGGRTYLELIAVQPGVMPPADMADLQELERLTPVGWAVAGAEMDPLREELQRAGFTLGEPQAGSRNAPSGATLRWQTFGLAEEVPGAPFFIVWAPGTPHPSTTSPQGCTLRRFRVASPAAAQLRRLQTALGLGIEVAEAATPGYSLDLDCPRGPVRFGS